MQKSVDDIILELSPIEKAVLPFLNLRDMGKIAQESKQPDVAVKRALEFLSNKGIVQIILKSKKAVSLGENGQLYLKQELPERRLLNFLAKNKKIPFNEAKEKSKLSNEEFSIALGVLKGKALISMSGGMIILTAKESEIAKQSPEEKFISELPLDFNSLTPEQKYSLDKLRSRKDVVKVEEIKDIEFEITNLGKELLKNSEKIKSSSTLIESLTPEMLLKGTWKNKMFRRYDIKSSVPRISGGKRQPYLSFLKDVREILVSLGFEESKGPLVETNFFNCDALFMPQNHPARGIHDLYFVKGSGDLKEHKKILANVKKVHEDGGFGSEGWKVPFSEKESEKLVLRSQGTAVSARILANNPKIPGKYFSVARVFRPDIIDASHLAEFNQLEGIVIDKSVNFKHLLGILKVFAEKLTGSKKVKFLPSYFPFTEPSVEGYLYHEKLGKWIEFGGAGIFRPEMTGPLGIKEPVLAWGLGVDRLYMIKENIHDIRQLFSSDLEWLRYADKKK